VNKLKQLETCGQSPWLDYLKRSLIEKGELRTMIERDGLKGVTSNPSIFEKAIGETDEYAEALKQFQAQADHKISAIYEHLAIADIRAATDVLSPVYEQTHGRDGHISLECSPYLANDTEATVSEAQRLWAAVDRPNLMVKVPATPAGIPAIRQLIGRGLNINITLLFAVSVYEQVVEAYLAGLEDLNRSGGDLSKIGSVASIFVSRIDVATDKRLDKLGDKKLADRLRGKAGIANSKIAYARYKALFSGPRWQPLAEAGAKTQRLLWASTSTKNPAYKDTMYVEALIGRDTVDTMPPATMDAFRDHGQVTPDAIEEDLESARAVLAELEEHGVSLKEVTDELVKDGVQQFADAFDKLFGTIAKRRRTLREGERASLDVAPGSREMKSAVDAEKEVWRKDGRIRRLWAGDPVARIRVKDVWHIGQEFFRWEIATAVAGSIIGIDPFNQPDVEASKDKTRALTDAYEKSHRLPEDAPVFRENGVALYADPRNAAELGRHNTLAGYLKSHFSRVHAGGKGGDYVALLAYIERNAAHSRAMTGMRARLRDKTRAATCLGFGPRFQHSTGQAYKGGPNSGVFLQVTCDDPADIAVPGHSYSFGVVKAAQASGDLAVLVERDRRALRVHLKHVDAGLEELSHAIDAALE